MTQGELPGQHVIPLPHYMGQRNLGPMVPVTYQIFIVRGLVCTKAILLAHVLDSSLRSE